MRLPGEKLWSPGTCTDTAGPRSYKVQVEQTVCKRNRGQLIKPGKPKYIPELIVSDKLADTNAEAEATALPEKCPPSEVDVEPRRSQRQVKLPKWLKDFVTP